MFQVPRQKTTGVGVRNVSQSQWPSILQCTSYLVPVLPPLLELAFCSRSRKGSEEGRLTLTLGITIDSNAS